MKTQRLIYLLASLILMLAKVNAQTYCTPTFSTACSTYNMYINSFSTTGVSSPQITNLLTGCSSASSYTYYPGLTASGLPGGTVNFTYTTGVTYQTNWRIWVDWNHDGTFNSTDEMMYYASTVNPTTTVTGNSFNVPITAIPGYTRMRVENVYYGSTLNATDACTAQSYGECEDYDFLVLSTGPQIPALAGYAYNRNTDTAWLNSPYIFTNTSNNATSYYWDITGYSTTFGGTYTPFSTTRKCATRWNTCYIDTTNKNFSYSFPQAGYYKVKLKVTNVILVNFTYTLTQDSIEKIVVCAIPSQKPVASFFSDRRKGGFTDVMNYYDLSLNGPTQWQWSLNPGYYGLNTFAGSGLPNSWNPNNTSQNTQLNLLDGGVFDVCLKVWNSKGMDSICRPGYLTVTNGYMMCNGSDSVSKLSSGYVYDAGGPTGNYYGQTTGNCPKGFRISACADSIVLFVERFKLAAGDSLEIINLSTGLRVKKIGGSNLPDSLKNYRVSGGQLFLKMTTNVSTNSDSGFAVQWTGIPASYSKPKSGFSCPTNIYSGYTMNYLNTSVGVNMTYRWDTNGDNIFGVDNVSVAIDSTVANPNVTYYNTTGAAISKKVCMIANNCKGDDTTCVNITINPLLSKPTADFGVNRTSGFTTDTFYFTDKSTNGALSWLWTFSPANVTYLYGTSATSQNPVVFLNSAIQYTITLRASNGIGNDTKVVPYMVNVVAYNSPGSSLAIPLGSDIGISRVKLGSIDTSTALQTPIYTAMYNQQKATLYRGVNYTLTTYRQSNLDPMSTKVWIDYNMNASFTDAGETLISESKQYKVSTSATFRISNNSPIGNTRMRVGISYDATILTPDYAQIGCFEDYGIIIGRDYVLPVLTLKGSAIQKMEVGKTYNESGVTATDNLEGDISLPYVRTGYVDTTKVGYYTLTYTVSDLYGNVSIPVTRIVQVEVNQTGPKLTLTGSDTLRVGVNYSYTEFGATAVDNLGRDISNLISITGTVNAKILGTYPLIYSVTDAFGFMSSKVRTVMVLDTIRPMIKSNTGKDTVRYQIGTGYVDQILVTDNYWTNLLSSVTRTGVINVNVAGYYTLLYNVTDGSGNPSIPYRLVVRIDNLVPPCVSLNGSLEMTVDVKGVFSDPGVTLTACGYYPVSSLTITKSPSNGPDMNTITGSNSPAIMTYTVCDPSGNCTVLTRKVNIVDRIAPVINLIGNSPYYHNRFTQYVDAGVNLTDNYYTDAQLRADASKWVVSNPVKNDGVEGTIYYVTYNLTDPSGNVANSIKRTVIIAASTTGVSNVNGVDNGIKLYPNPSNGKFTIEIDNALEVQTIKVYNIIGSLVREQSVKGNKTIEIDMSSEREGVYIVRVEGNGKSYTQKMNVVK